MKNLNVVLSVLVLSVISTACGNMSSQNGQGSIGSFNSSIGTQTGYSSSPSGCAAAPNVVAVGGAISSLSNQYRACNGGTANSVKIYAEDTTVRNICVIPVRVVSGGIQPFPNSIQCGSTSTAGVTVNFGSVPTNAVYVVDYNVYNIFLSCMNYALSTQSSLSACASAQGISSNYAYGQFAN